METSVENIEVNKEKMMKQFNKSVDLELQLPKSNDQRSSELAKTKSWDGNCPRLYKQTTQPVGVGY